MLTLNSRDTISVCSPKPTKECGNGSVGCVALYVVSHCFEASLVVFVVPGFLFFKLCHVCDCCGKWHHVAVAFSMTDGKNLYN